MKTLTGSRIEITDAIDSYLQSSVIKGKSVETGSGTKSPDNPFALGGVMQITGCGENLLANGSTEKTSTNEFMTYADLAPIFDACGLIQYTISFDIKSANISVQSTVKVYCQNGADSRYDIGQTVIPVTTEYARQHVTVVPKMQQNVTMASLAFYGGYNTGNIVTVKNVQIKIGSSDTAYQVYTGSTYALPQTLYSLPDGTTDEYDVVSGVGMQNVGKVVLNGTQTTFSFDHASSNGSVFKYYNAGNNTTGSQSGRIQCDKLKEDATGDWIYGKDSYYGGNVIAFCLLDSRTGIVSTDTADQRTTKLKTYLSANPVTVLYELATPITITGTAQQIRTYYPYTQIINNAGADMTVVTSVMDDLVASQPAWRIPKIDWNADGKINIEDWQRIDDNIWRIADFYGMTLPYKTWQYTSWPAVSEVARIENNISILLDQTHSFQTKFDYQLLNDIESCLLALHEKVVELQLSIRRAGTCMAGQKIYIPLGGVM